MKVYHSSILLLLGSAAAFAPAAKQSVQSESIHINLERFEVDELGIRYTVYVVPSNRRLISLDVKQASSKDFRDILYCCVEEWLLYFLILG
jgi:hypothetical protein